MRRKSCAPQHCRGSTPDIDKGCSGFDGAKLDEILDLRASGLRSCVILPIGYRQVEGDWLVNLKKVRRPRDQFVTEVK